MKLVSKGSTRLPRKHLRLKLGIALALTATTFGAGAAGLGRLSVLSSLGQPLRAEIEVTSVARDEAASLSAKLASADAFSQANIEYAGVLNGLRFSVQRRANGQPYILVTSSQLLNEPFLDVLVELSWGSGRLVREYTVLIDPPELRPGQSDVQVTPIAPTRAPSVVTRAAPTRSPAATSTQAPAAATPRAPTAPGASSGEYVVQSGDTAMSIARNNRTDGVSLEQMLAAIYRDNPQAFSGNIDRLMAGARVRIPDTANAKALDSGEARRIIASTSNFSSYRERIARNAAQAPAPSARSGAQASGQLSTQVVDGSVPATDAKDRLQLTRPDATKAAPGVAATRPAPTGPSPDELAAKERELAESKSRLALLEKNVADLQKLLELKTKTLAEIQQATPAKAPPAPAPSPAPAPVVAPPAPPPAPPPVVAPPAPPPVVAAPPAVVVPSPPPVVAAPPPVVVPSPPPAPAPVTPPVAAPVEAPAPVVAAPAPPPAPAKAPAKAGPVVAEESWLDAVKENSLLLIGGIVIVVLLLGYALFTARRRRKLSRFEDSIFVDNSVLHANSVFGTTGGQSIDTANTGFHSNFVPVAGSLPDQSEVDPVAEADVYIAYGRDAQAEEILKEALRADGSRNAVRLKLLEIYAKRADAKAFETLASELYASTGGQSEDWKQAAALGQSIDPHNALYAETAGVPSEPMRALADSHDLIETDALAGSVDAYGDRPHVPSAPPPPAPPISVPIAAVEHLRTDPMPFDRSSLAGSSPSMDLDFDLSNAGARTLPLASPPAPLPAPVAAPVQAPAPAQAPSAGSLDFDLGSSARPLVDPFTASAFGGPDPQARTAVNLPAFRARSDQDANASEIFRATSLDAGAAPPPVRSGSDDNNASVVFRASTIEPVQGRPAAAPPAGESASEIFKTSFVGGTEKKAREPDDGYSASEIFGTKITGDAEVYEAAPTPDRTQDFRNIDVNQFEKTEVVDAFANIDLNLNSSDYRGSDISTDFGAKTDVWQAMATKLDLALAYSDIGDKDGARELLDEVVRNGDQAQSDRARQLLRELG